MWCLGTRSRLPKSGWGSLIELARKMSLLDSIPAETLDRELAEVELASISNHLVNWPDKARDLGLSNGEIDTIKNDHHQDTKGQKRAMMRRWKEVYVDKATLRQLLRIAEKKGWVNFTREAMKELGYQVNGDGNV